MILDVSFFKYSTDKTYWLIDFFSYEKKESLRVRLELFNRRRSPVSGRVGRSYLRLAVFFHFPGGCFYIPHPRVFVLSPCIDIERRTRGLLRGRGGLSVRKEFDLRFGRQHFGRRRRIQARRFFGGGKGAWRPLNVCLRGGYAGGGAVGWDCSNVLSRRKSQLITFCCPW